MSFNGLTFNKSGGLALGAALILCFGQSAFAKEGMFTPDQLPEISKDLRKTGLKINPSQLSDLTSFPMGAIVSLGGCSASFVSEQGLVITNHHCSRGSVQYNSTEENNYLEDGFLAANFTEELPASPGSRIYVTKKVTDVTDRVLNGIHDGLSGEARFKAIETNRKALLAECEEDAGHRCQVSSFFGGSQYKLNKRLEIKDVRIVYSPSDAIGRYGGDIDNWLWPRHTGDFAFYRAYVSPKGESAEFSKDNVPYQPEHVLKVSEKGIEEGDFVMVAGYPGSTSRYSRLAEVNHVFGWEYPTWESFLKQWISTIESASPEGSDTRIKYEARLAGLNNYMKNLGGQIKGAERAGLVERRAERETALNSWISKNSQGKDFTTAITALDELSQETANAQRKSFAYSNVTRPRLLTAAKRLYRLSKERQKPDAERESGYQERDMTFFTERLQAVERRYDASVDKAEWMLFIDRYLEQPSELRVAAFDEALNLGDSVEPVSLSKQLDGFYDKTSLNNVDTRLSLMDG